MDIDEAGPSLTQINRDDDENEDEEHQGQRVIVVEKGIRVYKPPCLRCDSVGRPCAVVKEGESCMVCKRNKYQCKYGKKTATGKESGAGKQGAGGKGAAKKGAAKKGKGAAKSAVKTRKAKVVSEDSDMSPVIPTGPIGERYVEISDDMEDHPKQVRRQAGKVAPRDRGLAATVQKHTSPNHI